MNKKNFKIGPEKCLLNFNHGALTFLSNHKNFLNGNSLHSF